MPLPRRLRDKRGLIAAAVAAAALTATATLTLGGFNATVSNPTNTFSSGVIQLKENQAATNCFSTGTGTGGSVTAANTNAACAADNLGAQLLRVPGGAATSTTVTLTNVGDVNATIAQLTASACSAAAASGNNGYTGSDTAGYCGKVNVQIENDGPTGTLPAAYRCVYGGATTAPCPGTLSNTFTLSSMAAASPISLSSTGLNTGLATNTPVAYKITVQLDTTATNAHQGLIATVPLSWSISQ